MFKKVPRLLDHVSCRTGHVRGFGRYRVADQRHLDGFVKETFPLVNSCVCEDVAFQRLIVFGVAHLYTCYLYFLYRVQ